MVVQVATVWTLLDVAVLGEVLHPNPHVDHWLPAMLTVQAGLGGNTRCREPQYPSTSQRCPHQTNQNVRLLYLGT